MFTSNSNGTLLPFVEPSQKFKIILSSTGKTQSHKNKEPTPPQFQADQEEKIEKKRRRRRSTRRNIQKNNGLHRGMQYRKGSGRHSTL